MTADGVPASGRWFRTNRCGSREPGAMCGDVAADAEPRWRLGVAAQIPDDCAMSRQGKLGPPPAGSPVRGAQCAPTQPARPGAGPTKIKGHAGRCARLSDLLRSADAVSGTRRRLRLARILGGVELGRISVLDRSRPARMAVAFLDWWAQPCLGTSCAAPAQPQLPLLRIACTKTSAVAEHARHWESSL